EPMTKILLTRHGHVDGIKPQRFRGREPLALTARGRAEAEAVAQRIAGAWRPSQVYTSPMGRCIETATAIAKACDIAATTCDDLNDIDYGAWQFTTFADAKMQNPALFAAWLATPHLVRFPNGEALQDVAARVANAVRAVLARHPDEAIVLVGHDSVNRALLLQFLDLPPSAYWRLDQTPCCLNEIDIGGETVCVRRINETAHVEAVAREHDAP
ncbi:MAG TPA: histidine phosphatase family protein, partial [Xanthobacteraceae bacterium]|nr:histidine phosphatase family protein [Xanthobacteraceae bacterium]